MIWLISQVPRLWWTLPSSRGPADRLWPHWPVIYDCPERLWFLVPQGAQGRPRLGLHIHGQEGLFCPMPLDVFQQAGADLHPLLHRSRFHCLPVCNTLHIPDVSHWCYQVWMVESIHLFIECDHFLHKFKCLSITCKTKVEGKCIHYYY